MILLLLILATLGSGMMAGLFCSFSIFILQALGEIPPEKGIAAMQSINRVIVKPAFLIVFMGTAGTSALVILIGWEQLNNAALAWTAAGTIVYLLGNIGVTIIFNVPLNNLLAAVDCESPEGAGMWTIYLEKWARWNHLRSISTIVSTVFLIFAIFHVNGQLY